MSLWIGLTYALGFELTGIRSNWRMGALGSLVHWSIATVVTGVASKKHPKREQLAMPGFGGMALGIRSAIGFLVSHIVYGMLFGWQYGDSPKQ
jgi:biotin transporter BioY